MKLGFKLLGVALGMSLSLHAARAAEFPEREIYMTVNYGAGGVTDNASRLLARAMEKHLGKPIVVQNRPGGQATIAPGFIMRQKPDGYNIGAITMAAMAIAPHLVQTPYNTDDFEYIGAYGRFRFGMAVRADSPYKNVADLVNAAKASPKPIFFGAPGAPQNVTMYELGRKTGAKFEQVLYKSGAETVMALISGDVEVLIQTPSEILPHVKSGKLRLIAAVSPARWPDLPDMPTVREQGFDMSLQSWMGLLAPKGTPKEVVNKLRDAMFAASKDPEFMQGLTNMGIDPLTLGGPEYVKLVKEAYAQMEAFAKQTGVKKGQQ